MKLPRADDAVVDIEKLRYYCLNPLHPRGRHKARVFASALGLAAENADELREALLVAAKTHDANPAEYDAYGQRYVLDFQMTGSKGKATVRSSWIIRTGESFPRLTSCFVI